MKKLTGSVAIALCAALGVSIAHASDAANGTLLQTLRTRFQLPASKTETVSRIIRDAVDQEWVKLEDPNGSKRYARYVPFWA